MKEIMIRSVKIEDLRADCKGNTKIRNLKTQLLRGGVVCDQGVIVMKFNLKP